MALNNDKHHQGRRASAALILMGLLAFSVATIAMSVRPAFAATSLPYGSTSADIAYYFADGTIQVVGAHTTQTAPPGTIFGNNPKEIKDIEFRVHQRTTSTADKITGANIKVVARVEAADGTWKTIPLGTPSGVSQRSGDLWWLYRAKVPASTIDNLIGTVPSTPSGLWPSTVALFVSSQSTFTGTIAGKTGTFHFPIGGLTTDADVFKKAGAIVPDPDPDPIECPDGTHVYNNTCVPDPEPEPEPQPLVPSGRIYTVFKVQMSDGTITVIDNKDTQYFPADLLLFGQSGSIGTGTNAVEKITYVVMMRLDNYEDFNVPFSVTEQPGWPANSHHYDVLVDNTSITKAPSTQIDNKSNGLFELVKISASKADIEPQLKGPTATLPSGETYKSGKIKFFVQGYQVVLTGGGKSYPVAIPEFSETLSLGSTVLPDPTPDPDPDGCTLLGDICNPDTPAGFDVQTGMIVLGAVVVMGAVGYGALKRKK